MGAWSFHRSDSLCWACHSYPFIPERRHATAHATRFPLASLMAECCWTGISDRAPLQAQRGMVSGDAPDGSINPARPTIETKNATLGWHFSFVEPGLSGLTSVWKEKSRDAQCFTHQHRSPGLGGNQKQVVFQVTPGQSVAVRAERTAL